MKLIEGHFINTVKGHGKITILIPTHFGWSFKLELPDGSIVSCHQSDVIEKPPSK